MQNKKDTILEKFVKKDYNNNLELIVENKDFNESAKNLLLEILYKIEAAYKDYKTVKVDVETEEEYIEKLLNIVKNKCKKINVVKANSEEAKVLEDRNFLVDTKKQEIISYPIERKLLYAIAKINKTDEIIKDNYFIINKTLSKALNVGNNIDMVEIIRDFNGWSWSISSKEIENLEYNLVYQIIRILIGNKFLNEWINNNEFIIDYLELFENKLEKKYGRDDSKKFISNLKIFSILMELKLDEKEREKIINLKEEVDSELNILSDKEKFIVDIAKTKKEIKSKIKDVDTIINDKKLLQEEYDKRNSKLPIQKKIFSRRILADMLFDERDELLKQYEQLNDLLNPMKYLSKKINLEEKQKYLKLAEIENIDFEIKKVVIEIQKNFLNCFSKLINEANTKSEITNIIYNFRYYCMIYYDFDTKVYEVKELKNMIEQIEMKIIGKAIELKVIYPVSNAIEQNFKIIKNIFNTKIIKLEETNIKITKEKETYIVQFLDENVLDEKFEICKKEEFNKKDFNIKVNKIFKLFA